MARSTNSFSKFYSAIDLQVEQPLDYRSIVDYKSDLITLQNVPQGFITTVLHDANESASGSNSAPVAVYYLKGANSHIASDWEKLAIDNNQFAATDLTFKGSYENATAATTAISDPENGWYYYDQALKQFTVYKDNAWSKLCSILDASIDVSAADSLSFEVNYNGVNIPTNKNGKSVHNIDNLVSLMYTNADNVYKLVEDSNTTLTIKKDNGDPVNGAQVNLYFPYDKQLVISNTLVTFNTVLLFGKNVDIDIWNKDDIIPVVYNAAADKWVVLENSYLNDKFDFSLDTFDWASLIGMNPTSTDETIINTSDDLAGFPEIFDAIVDLQLNTNSKKKIKFLLYNGSKFSFDCNGGESSATVSFIYRNYYVQINLIRLTVDDTVTYKYSVSVKDIVADATVYNVTEGDSKPVSSGAVYSYVQPLFNALQWNDNLTA